ncbi:MAG: putative metallopeptidase [Caldisphaera sp.]|jgi:predicted metallopeptidase|nr:MAG: metallopeptidase [Caldisphaera sp.]PMP88819.1 MAG: metallopeptidase [Caldisphaera sp.]
MIKYQKDIKLENLVRCVILSLNMDYIKQDNVFIIRSFNTKTKAVARIYSIPSAIRYVMKIEPIYVIEIISEKFDKLTYDEKVKVIIHELLHIPIGFTGGLRPHGDKVNERIVNKLFKKINLENCIY